MDKAPAGVENRENGNRFSANHWPPDEPDRAVASDDVPRREPHGR